MRESSKYIYIFLLLGFFTMQCTRWYEDLPPGIPESCPSELAGIWEKPLKPNSPMNSKIFFNRREEKIQIQNSHFTKSYRTSDKFGDNTRETSIMGNGTIHCKENWILFKTEKLTTTQSSWNSKPKTEEERVKISLLYHYDKKTESIIPMVHDTGYRIKPFGVMELMSGPFTIDTRFWISRNQFAKKEFQSHAYFRKSHDSK